MTTIATADMIAKLQRQPLHDQTIVISWRTRDEIIDLLAACQAERIGVRAPIQGVATPPATVVDDLHKPE